MSCRNTLQGLKLMILNGRFFNPRNHFKNKRIAVIGAADSAFEQEKGDYINDFDFIIRVNKAPHSLTLEKKKYIGDRTDILFHSFFEKFQDGGGGTIDWNLYKKQGIRYVINPNTNLKGLRAHLNFYKRNLTSHKTFLLQPIFYRKMSRNFGNWVPTVGHGALYSVLNSGCKEVYITGFTFFKTPYADDYRDDLKDVEKNNQFMKKQGYHNPDLELNEFIAQLDGLKKQGTHVEMDAALTSIVENQKKKINGKK